MEEKLNQNESITSQIKQASKEKNWGKVAHLKKKLKTKRQNTEMFQKVQEGLETNILKEDNIGFKMLQKMGFNKNQGLGKEGKGIKEPIIVNLPTNDKKGIGTEKKETLKPKKVEKEEVTTEMYLEAMKKKYLLSRETSEKRSQYGDDFDEI